MHQYPSFTLIVKFLAKFNKSKPVLYQKDKTSQMSGVYPRNARKVKHEKMKQ